MGIEILMVLFQNRQNRNKTEIDLFKVMERIRSDEQRMPN